MQQALQSGQLQGGGDLSDTSFIQQLPAYLAHPFKVGFSDSIDMVFLIAAFVVAVGFFVFLLLPQLALSTKSGIQARQAAGGTATSEPGDAAGQAAEAMVAAAPTSAPPAAAPSTGDGTRTGDGAPHP